jgi:hypothetical protein
VKRSLQVKQSLRLESPPPPPMGLTVVLSGGALGDISHVCAFTTNQAPDEAKTTVKNSGIIKRRM